MKGFLLLDEERAGVLKLEPILQLKKGFCGLEMFIISNVFVLKVVNEKKSLWK